MFGIYLPSCDAPTEINTKLTLEWAHKHFVTRVYILFNFLNSMYDNDKITFGCNILELHIE